jgi:hypothetical protein
MFARVLIAIWLASFCFIFDLVSEEVCSSSFERKQNLLDLPGNKTYLDIERELGLESVYYLPRLRQEICLPSFDSDILDLPEDFELSASRHALAIGHGTQWYWNFSSPDDHLSLRLFVGTSTAGQAVAMFEHYVGWQPTHRVFHAVNHRDLGDIAFVPGPFSEEGGGYVGEFGFVRRNVVAIIHSTDSNLGYRVAKILDDLLQETELCKEADPSKRIPKLVSIPSGLSLGLNESQSVSLRFDPEVKEPWSVGLSWSGTDYALEASVVDQDRLELKGLGQGSVVLGICVFNSETLRSRWWLLDVELTGPPSEEQLKMMETDRKLESLIDRPTGGTL